MAGGGEDCRGNDSVHGGGAGGGADRVAADGSGYEHPPGTPAGVSGGSGSGDAAFVGGRSDAGLQHRTDSDRPDVQPGAGADDDVWLRVLSMERALGISNPAICRTGESIGVCERGIARVAGAAVSAYRYAG